MHATEDASERVRVLTVHFSPVVRDGLQAMLAVDKRIELVAHASDVDEALAYIGRQESLGLPVRVVLTETRSGSLHGVETTRRILEAFPNTAVLVLTANANDSYVIDSIQAGAGGYLLLHDMTAKVLLESIHGVLRGGTQMSTKLLRNSVADLLSNGRKTAAERTTEAARLTQREIDVLRLMASGYSNKMVAAELGITLDTAKKHVRNVIEKMHARSRTDAAIIAARAGVMVHAPVAEGEPGASAGQTP